MRQEVLDMSRAAEERLAQVNRRNEYLKHLIEAEQEIIDGPDSFSGHLGADLHMEEGELSVALDRARDATQTEIRRTQVALSLRPSLAVHTPQDMRTKMGEETKAKHMPRAFAGAPDVSGGT